MNQGVSMKPSDQVRLIIRELMKLDAILMLKIDSLNANDNSAALEYSMNHTRLYNVRKSLVEYETMLTSFGRNE